MKKLRMNLDDLRVDSFATEDPALDGGTVFGLQERPKPISVHGVTCGNATQFSCVYSCHGADCSLESCVISCPGGATCGAICNHSRVICPAPSAGADLCGPRPD